MELHTKGEEITQYFISNTSDFDKLYDIAISKIWTDADFEIRVKGTQTINENEKKVLQKCLYMQVINYEEKKTA